MPKAAHCPADTTYTLPRVQRELLKPTPVHQGLIAARRNQHHTHSPPAQSPSCTLRPAYCHGLTAEQGSYYEFLQNSRVNGPTWAPPRSPSCKGKQPHKENPHGNQTSPEQSSPSSPQCHSLEHPNCIPPGSPVQPPCRQNSHSKGHRHLSPEEPVLWNGPSLDGGSGDRGRDTTCPRSLACK